MFKLLVLLFVIKLYARNDIFVNTCVFSSIFHKMGKAWKIGRRENPTQPIICGEPGKLVLILFP